jgi:hypothetical protein
VTGRMYPVREDDVVVFIGCVQGYRMTVPADTPRPQTRQVATAVL